MTLDRDIAMAAALEYGQFNWPVFPGNGKVPAIPNPHPKGSVERQTCKGECGLQGHGHRDATTDQEVIESWWTGRYAGANILGRIPESMMMLDTDPYKGGLESWAELQRRHGELPETLTDYSGRRDGGAHYFFRRPPGRLTAKRLGPGIDLKTSNGYTVLPPSIHLETGWPYVREERPVATPTPWLVTLLRPEPPQAAPPRPRRLSRFFFSGSIADEYDANSSWADILQPHGWRCIDADPDARRGQMAAPDRDVAHARRPCATAACSCTAQIRRLTSPNRHIPRATPGFAPTRCSTTTATCPQLRAH